MSASRKKRSFRPIWQLSAWNDPFRLSTRLAQRRRIKRRLFCFQGLVGPQCIFFECHELSFIGSFQGAERMDVAAPRLGKRQVTHGG